MNKMEIGIVGTGAIGTSLAALFTGHGYKTTVLDIKPEADFFSAYDALFREMESRKLVTEKQKLWCRRLAAYTADYTDLKDAEIIFECIPEFIELKRKVLKNIEENCAKFRVLASTASGLPPEDLQKGLTKWPEKLVVAHPFNPAHLVPLVEIVKHDKTDEKAVLLMRDFLESCGREVCVVQKSIPGFIANRLQHAMLREAFYLFENGVARPRDIEKAMKFSFIPRYMHVGIFEHNDGYGLDMLESLQNYMWPSLADGKQAPDIVVNQVKAGHLGMKTGKGVYEWSEEAVSDFKKRAAEPYWQFFNWKFPVEESTLP